MLHFMFSNEPNQSAMLPDDQLLEALPKFNAAFPLTFSLLLLVYDWSKQVFRTAANEVGGPGHLN